MIVERTVIGSKDTSFHDFQVNLNGMSITISSGSYFLNNAEVYKNDSDYTQTITSSTGSIYVEIWLTKGGFAVISGDVTAQTLTDPIDRLVWFTVPAICTDLSTIDINFVKIIEN